MTESLDVDLEESVEEPEEAAPPVPPEGERRRGPRFSFWTSTLLLAAVALFGGFLIMNLVLMPSFTRQGAEVQVPDIAGQSEVEAERVLAAQDLKLSKISEQWSPDIPRGYVISQDPAAGGAVKRGRRISVIVSLGAQGTSVPALDGVTARQAQLLLEGAGLRAGRIARVYTDEVSKDLVVSSDPPGETLVEQGTVVNLLVSSGPRPETFLLPDLTGKDLDEVSRSLRENGFLVLVREGGPKEKSGLVSAQEPPPGHRIAPRDSIVLFEHP
jgi:eukaryotic-like serine/threonine-protein kinase